MRDIAGPRCYPNYTHGDFPEYRYPQSLCAKMSTCLLQNTDEFSKADMQSATIILGVMPSILSDFSSKAGEVALLSARRPMLTALLAFGAPAVFATRPFELDGTAASLKRDIGTLRLGRQTPGRAAGIGAAQYLLVTFAAANCVLNSVQLGTSTILSWKCSWSYMELIWNFMALISHLYAAVSIRYSKLHRSPNRTVSSPSGRLANQVWSESQPCANHAKPEFNTGPSEGRIAVFLNWTVALLGYAHWIFGTLVFSSVLLIGTLDAFGVVPRYLMSALVCRAIVLVELAGMRGAREAEDTRDAGTSSLGGENRGGSGKDCNS